MLALLLLTPLLAIQDIFQHDLYNPSPNPVKTLIIRRVSTGRDGTFGVILHKDIPFALTLERQWLDNRTSISCIPAGNYKCKRTNSPKFGGTFEVTNVPGRTHILFHKGNIDDDSHGCILIGEQFEHLGDSPAILASKKGFGEFMKILMAQIDFRLIVVDDWKTDLNC